MDKRCFKCGEIKPIGEFYRHPKMADGHLGKCKECTKADVTKRYRENPEKMAEYERKRYQRAERRKAVARLAKQYKKDHPERVIAHSAVSNAIRDGRLERLPCIICGNPKSEGHHKDYSKPLEVVWLCRKHHRAAHGKGANPINV